MNFRLVALVTGLAALFASIIFSLTVLWVDSVVADDAAQRAHAESRKAMAEFQAKVWIAGVISEPAHDVAVAKIARSNAPTRQFVDFIPNALGMGIVLAALGLFLYFVPDGKRRSIDRKEEPFRFAKEFREAIR